MKTTSKLWLVYREKGRKRKEEIVDPSSFVPVIRIVNGVSRGKKKQETEVWLAGGEMAGSYIEDEDGGHFFEELYPLGIENIMWDLSQLGFRRFITLPREEDIFVPLNFKLGPIEEFNLGPIEEFSSSLGDVSEEDEIPF